MPAETRQLPAQCAVAIVGSGPSGLAAATRLMELGVDDIVLLEREPQAGGVPRHCGHIPFGLREFRRCLTGPAYASELVARANRARVNIQLATTVVRAEPGGLLTLSTPDGLRTLTAARVVLATGIRETPRAARLVAGQRPLGVLSTGALQSMVYLNRRAPCRQPVIVGTELVAFSALLTCRHAKINPVAMIEAGGRIAARSFSQLLPLALRVPLRYNTRVEEILGAERVTGVRLRNAAGIEQQLVCDGVIFSGQFTPESALLTMGHLRIDPASGGPVIDQYGRCSDAAYFATGNLLRPVETAGWCWREGRQTAEYVAASMAGELPDPHSAISVVCNSSKIKLAIPQHLATPCRDQDIGMRHIQIRFAEVVRGRLLARSGVDVLWSRKITGLPERRILIPITDALLGVASRTIYIDFQE